MVGASVADFPHDAGLRRAESRKTHAGQIAATSGHGFGGERVIVASSPADIGVSMDLRTLPKTLTKTAFKLAAECPQKLAYVKDPRYVSTN